VRCGTKEYGHHNCSQCFRSEDGWRIDVVHDADAASSTNPTKIAKRPSPNDGSVAWKVTHISPMSSASVTAGRSAPSAPTGFFRDMGRVVIGRS
jgi:hypothetical protein